MGMQTSTTTQKEGIEMMQLSLYLKTDEGNYYKSELESSENGFDVSMGPLGIEKALKNSLNQLGAELSLSIFAGELIQNRNFFDLGEK